MKRRFFLAGMLSAAVLLGAAGGHAATWVENRVDILNKNVQTNYYDADSVKVSDKTLIWTEKFQLTEFGEKAYTKHLKQYPACMKNIAEKGNVTHHQVDFEIKEGKWRMVAKRNYNKKDELVCTDKEMNNELDTRWYKITNHSPMSERYYIFVTKFKVGNI